MKISRDHVIGYVIMLVLGVGVGMGGLTLTNRTRPAPIEIVPPAPSATPAPTATPGPIAVFVNGAVQAPEVYSLPPGSRVADAIEAAGGFAVDAQTAVINLAQPLSDGVQVYVPALAEETAVGPGVGVAPAAGVTQSGSRSATAIDVDAEDGALVNINTAMLAELDALPGIGPSTAQKIIDHRAANGPFASIQAIMEVSGIGESKFAEIEARITVGP